MYSSPSKYRGNRSGSSRPPCHIDPKPSLIALISDLRRGGAHSGPSHDTELSLTPPHLSAIFILPAAPVRALDVDECSRKVGFLLPHQAPPATRLSLAHGGC